MACRTSATCASRRPTPTRPTATATAAATGAPMTFLGFAQPIDDRIVNAATAGRTVPVRYRLVDAAGQPIADPSTFVALTFRAEPSSSCAGAPSDDVETSTADDGLRYLGHGTWQLNWKTPKAFAGQCRTMTLELRDGGRHQARFVFR